MTKHEAMAYMFLAAAFVVFYGPVARPVARGCRWLWVRRPWGLKERAENARLVRRLNHEIHYVHTDACPADCAIGGRA